jgi:hypothetical protein
MERLIDMELTAEFHTACVKRDNEALKVLVDKLGNARIGFMNGVDFVDSTNFYTDRDAMPVFTPEGEKWEGWRGDLVWREPTPEPNHCTRCKQPNCPSREAPADVNF